MRRTSGNDQIVTPAAVGVDDRVRAERTLDTSSDAGGGGPSPSGLDRLGVKAYPDGCIINAPRLAELAQVATRRTMRS
jgi:hypothetical protein